MSAKLIFFSLMIISSLTTSHAMLNFIKKMLPCFWDQNNPTHSPPWFVVTGGISNEELKRTTKPPVWECAAALISPKDGATETNLALTSEWCMTTRPKTNFVGGFGIKIPSGEMEQTVKIRDIVKVTCSDGKVIPGLSLIIFEIPVQFTNNIQPIRLPQNDVPLPKGTVGFSGGYHTVHPDFDAYQKWMILKITVKNNDSCKFVRSMGPSSDITFCGKPSRHETKIFTGAPVGIMENDEYVLYGIQTPSKPVDNLSQLGFRNALLMFNHIYVRVPSCLQSNGHFIGKYAGH